MLTIYYSPHMTSVDNEAGRASGHANVALAERGRQQALALARHYAAIPLDAAYCSDLRRAVDTAALLFDETGVSIMPDARLREFDYGALTQAPREQVEAEFPLRITEPFPGGESMMDVVERVGAFLRDTLTAHEDGAIAVIGHRGTKWGLDYWSSDAPLQQIVLTPWEWRAVPIWRYSIERGRLAPKPA